MAEMLVVAVDKVNGDKYLDAKCYKRGDVVVVCPDGWQWSAEERKNPNWRIVKLPRVTELEASAFLGPELDETSENPSKVLQRRAFKFDLDTLEKEHKELADEKRKADAIAVDKAYAEVAALKVAKPRLVDPADGRGR